jgi:hypothetical protein
MRIINVSSCRFALPEGMSTKDVQALVGFLATLQNVDSHYDYGTNDYLFSLGSNPEVRLGTVTLTENAKAKSDASYEAYKAKRDAEKAAAA